MYSLFSSVNVGWRDEFNFGSSIYQVGGEEWSTAIVCHA